LLNRKARKSKIQKIRKAKHLVRELKRYLKEDDNMNIVGSFLFSFENREIEIKKGVVNLIMNEHGAISGLLIDNGGENVQLRL
jgi:uncharacterized protein (UPF0305 family)